MKKIVDDETGQLSELQGLHLTMQQHPPRFYEPVGISVTNPDAGMTIRELVERYASGEAGPVHDVFFDDDENNVIKTGFDLSDLTDAQNVIDSAREISDKKKALADKGSDEPEPTINKEAGEDGVETKQKPNKVKARAKVDTVRPASEGSGSDELAGEA